jgi:dTDP-4-dehydrorhamnose 3,5-epimerase|tara:strand:+ start:527 stop:724 length:198 start_codon:yes stop_codon:yes gene_type:complete
MQIEETTFPEVFIITPKVYGDSRGFFLASYNSREFNNAIGKEVNFVQDNHSKSAKDVLTRSSLSN